MKKVLIGLLAIVLLVITFNYCTSSNDGEETEKISVKIKPEKSKISGSLEGYLEVVSSEYNLSEDVGMPTITIKIRGVKAMSKELVENKYFLLGMNILTKEGMPLSDIDELKSSYDDVSKIENILLKGSGEAYIELVGFGDLSEKPSKFSLTSYTEDVEEETEDSLETASSDGDSEGSVNYDKMLDDYDKYVTQYIAIAKKMKKGDQSAIAEYPKFMEKTQKLGESLEKVQNDDNFTPEQMGRMSKIQMRMLEVMK